MSYFDSTLEAEPVAEQNTDPILPEERFVFTLIGFERSQPDQWHKNGGIKWTFAVAYPNGQPFIFDNAPYELWRTTNVNAAGKPLFTLGTQPHEWASALLGRQLGVDEHFAISELRDKKFSSQVVWQPKRTKPTEKAAVLASLRHVPVGAAPASNGRAAKPAADQVSADPSEDDVDRALILTGIEKSVNRLKKLDAASGKDAAAALAASDADAPMADLERLHEQVKAAIQKALDD